MIFYVILTYGPRPFGSIRTHPAAKTQLAVAKRLVDQRPGMPQDIRYDYARSISGLGSLPTLERILRVLKEVGGVRMCIDDLSRLFRITGFKDREKLLTDLQAFGTCLFSVRHKKTLSEFSAAQLHDLILHAEKWKPPARKGVSGDTTMARASSLKSRTHNSIRTAQKLMEIRKELMDSGGNPTLQMVAERANTQGLRTTRGRDWTAQNVDRSLKLLEREKHD